MSRPITMPLGRSLEYKPPHPERTARKSTGWLGINVTFREWPSRAAMLTTIRMQERRESRLDDWSPVVPER